MKLLLDTHVVMWCLADDPRLSSGARELIRDPDNAVFVSTATVWEMAIKRALGRLDIDLARLDDALVAMGFAPLSINHQHAAGTSSCARCRRTRTRNPARAPTR